MPKDNEIKPGFVSILGNLAHIRTDHGQPDQAGHNLSDDEVEWVHTLSYSIGYELTKRRHPVRVGAFSELDFRFAKGAIKGAQGGEGDSEDLVEQIIIEGPRNKGKYLCAGARHSVRMKPDDFRIGESDLINGAKSIIVLGGFLYARMLAIAAYNRGVPVFGLPHGELSGEHIWQQVLEPAENAKLSIVFPGASVKAYRELGNVNMKTGTKGAVKLANKLCDLIEKASDNWVKPSTLPEDMRYKPASRYVQANTAFIAMPFGEEGTEKELESDKVYAAIRQACEKAGFKGRRSDHKSLFDPKNLGLMAEITELIVASHIVIVDMRDRNANVFYELGIADTLGKPMILLFDDNGKVPADVQDLRRLGYKLANLKLMTTKLANILKKLHLNTQNDSN